jgi:glycosyltransferase involved in cell wall biosynthesis
MVVPPAVATVPPTVDPSAFRSELGIPASSRLILAVGRMDNFDRFRNAIWGFDVLKHLTPDVWLVLVGDGEDRPRIEAFARKLGHDDVRVVFAGARPDAAGLMHLGEVVWVANRNAGGTNVALEAMAAGKPVIASALPNLSQIVRDRETGFLVSPREPPALARRTWQLFNDPNLARGLGEAGRARAVTAFSTAAMAERFSEVYDGVTSIAIG